MIDFYGFAPKSSNLKCGWDPGATVPRLVEKVKANLMFGHLGWPRGRPRVTGLGYRGGRDHPRETKGTKLSS